jgi:hypothetical protein
VIVLSVTDAPAQIVIGRRALAIDRRVRASAQRPMRTTCWRVIEHGRRAREDRHNDPRSTPLCRLVIRRNGELIEVDSRPSDAIALGVAGDVPLYIADHVLDEAGT